MRSRKTRETRICASSALAALADVAWSEGDLERVRRFVEERLSLLPALSDPDDRHFALMSGVNINLETGRLSQARELSLRLQEMVEGLHLTIGYTASRSGSTSKPGPGTGRRSAS